MKLKWVAFSATFFYFIHFKTFSRYISKWCFMLKSKTNQITRHRFTSQSFNFLVFGCKTLTCIMKLKYNCILGVAIKLSNRVFMEFWWWFIIVVWFFFKNNCLKTMVYWAKPIEIKTIASSNANLLQKIMSETVDNFYTILMIY